MYDQAGYALLADEVSLDLDTSGANELHDVDAPADGRVLGIMWKPTSTNAVGINLDVQVNGTVVGTTEDLPAAAGGTDGTLFNKLVVASGQTLNFSKGDRLKIAVSGTVASSSVMAAPFVQLELANRRT